MKTIKLLLLSCTLFTTILHAQFSVPSYKNIQEMKNRQLVVIVNPPNPDIVNKFSKKGNEDVMKEYQQIIGDYNDDMKNAVTKFWTFNSKEILFKTRVELNDMTRDKKDRDKYIIIYCYSFDSRPKRDMDWKINKSGERATGSITYFAIGFPDEMPVYEQPLKKLIPTATVLTYYVARTNFIFNYIYNHKKDIKLKDIIYENSPVLAKKTLLILKDDVSPKVINDINTYYPCSFKLVDDDEMEKAVTSGDAQYAYLIKTGIEPNDEMNFIVNCEDGAILAYTKTGSELVGFTTDQGLKKDFFRDIADFCSPQKK